jgi:cell division protein ZipA
MDKELLRLVIVLIGVLVMIGMWLWHFFKTFQERRETDYFNESSYEGMGEEFEDEDDIPTRVSHFSKEALVDGDGLLDEETLKPVPPVDATLKVPSKPNVSRSDWPKLIEFSLVARADIGFNGEKLWAAFKQVNLEFGSVKVFERVDKQRLVHFAVASMSGSGTFPDTDLENFYCPGIVFFLQPRELEKPLRVFDDFIETIDILAEELDGVVWDNQKQPLTAETIAQLRQILAEN